VNFHLMSYGSDGPSIHSLNTVNHNSGPNLSSTTGNYPSDFADSRHMRKYVLRFSCRSAAEMGKISWLWRTMYCSPFGDICLCDLFVYVYEVNFVFGKDMDCYPANRRVTIST
jgi:hypothetical protein